MFEQTVEKVVKSNYNFYSGDHRPYDYLHCSGRWTVELMQYVSLSWAVPVYLRIMVGTAWSSDEVMTQEEKELDDSSCLYSIFYVYILLSNSLVNIMLKLNWKLNQLSDVAQ